MNEKEILNLVLEMRKAQSKYFRTRYVSDLDNARILEHRVDAELKKYFNPDNQLSMSFSSTSWKSPTPPMYMVALSKTPPAMYI